MNENDKKAVKDLKEKIRAAFPDTEFILFGSKARGSSDEESDIDVLVIINGEVNTAVENNIYNICYDVELEHDVVFGLIVESKAFWESGRAAAMPLRWNVDKEGIRL